MMSNNYTSERRGEEESGQKHNKAVNYSNFCAADVLSRFLFLAVCK